MGAFHSLYHLYRLQRRLFWPEDELEALRRKKLASLLTYCYQYIPYYQEQFKRLGAHPEDFRSPDQLQDFPIVEKETLRDRQEEFIPPKADRKDWIRYSSSGSTGIPLELWYHPSERTRMGFTMTREYLYHGLKPWHRLVNVTEPRHFGPKNRWYHRLGLMNEKFLSIFDRADLNLARLRKIDPHLLMGFPSILLLIGNEMMSEDRPPLRPRWLFTLAEVLTAEFRRILTEQWGTEPIDIYGANEAGHIAFQCAERKNYHINLDSVHVDIVAGDRTAGAGEWGELVVTNFDLRVMPIIRYRVGDIARRVTEQCPCGCRFPLLGQIAGRSDGFIAGTDGTLYSALEASLLLHPIGRIRHFRLIQEQPGHVIVEWVPKAQDMNPEDDIRAVLKKHLGADMAIEPRKVTEISREKSGKIRSVISKLPHPFR